MLLLLPLLACGPSLSLLNGGETALKRPGASQSTSADGVAAGTDGSVWVFTQQSNHVLKLGETNATLEVELTSSSAPIVLADGSIVAHDSGAVVHLSAQGEELWRTNAPGTLLTHLAQRSDGSVLGAGTVQENGTDNGYALFALSADGQETGRAQLLDQPRSTIAVGPNDTVYVGSSELLALDPNLTELWAAALPATLDSIAVDDTRVFVHTVTNNLLALDTTTGDTLWTAVGVGGDPVLTSNDRLYVTDASETNAGVWVLDARDGEVLMRSDRACLGGAVGADDNLYVACRFPDLYPSDAFPQGAPFIPTLMSPTGLFEFPDSSVDNPGPSFGAQPAEESVVLLEGEAWFVGGTEVLHYSTKTAPATTAWSNTRGSASRLGRSQ